MAIAQACLHPEARAIGQPTTVLNGNNHVVCVDTYPHRLPIIAIPASQSNATTLRIRTMATPQRPSIAKRIGQFAIDLSVAILCCPCITCVLILRTGRSRAVRATTHHVLLTAPAPPPAYISIPDPANDSLPVVDKLMEHLMHEGNRVFHLRPDTGVLESGNLAAAHSGFHVVGKPKLIATLPREKWRPLLAEFMSAREHVTEKSGGAWKAKEKKTRLAKREKSWVNRCSEVLKDWGEQKGSVEEGGWFEVWSADVITPQATAVVDQKIAGAGVDVQFVRGPFFFFTTD